MGGRGGIGGVESVFVVRPPVCRRLPRSVGAGLALCSKARTSFAVRVATCATKASFEAVNAATDVLSAAVAVAKLAMASEILETSVETLFAYPDARAVEASSR